MDSLIHWFMGPFTEPVIHWVADLLIHWLSLPWYLTIWMFFCIAGFWRFCFDGILVEFGQVIVAKVLHHFFVGIPGIPSGFRWDLLGFRVFGRFPNEILTKFQCFFLWRNLVAKCLATPQKPKNPISILTKDGLWQDVLPQHFENSVGKLSKWTNPQRNSNTFPRDSSWIVQRFFKDKICGKMDFYMFFLPLLPQTHTRLCRPHWK